MVNLGFSQEIEIEKYFTGYYFVKDGKYLNYNELVSMMPANKLALEQMKKARNKHKLASVLGLGGLAMVGIPTGKLIAGSQPNWNWAIAGAAAIGVAIPIEIHANKKVKEAVDIFNNNPVMIKDSKLHPQVNIRAQGFKLGVFVCLR